MQVTAVETPTPTPTPEATPDPIGWLITNRPVWPKEVKLTVPCEFSLVIGGKVAGKASAPAGAILPLVEIERNRVNVTFGSSTEWVTIESTDLMSRIDQLKSIADARQKSREALEVARAAAAVPTPMKSFTPSSMPNDSKLDVFHPVNTPTEVAGNFSGGSLAPFFECTTKKPNYVKASYIGGKSCAEVFWTQVGFDGTRMKKGAEGCCTLKFPKEGWYAFKFYLPAKGYPYDKEAGMAQIFSLGGCCSWAAMFSVSNNQLKVCHRAACSTPTGGVICSDIKRDQWNQVRIHFVASHQGQGLLEVWYGDSTSPVYQKRNISFGFGEWDGDQLAKVDHTSRAGTAYIDLKFGQYNYDVPNYTPGESRTSYYTDIIMSLKKPEWAGGDRSAGADSSSPFGVRAPPGPSPGNNLDNAVKPSDTPGTAAPTSASGN